MTSFVPHPTPEHVAPAPDAVQLPETASVAPLSRPALIARAGSLPLRQPAEGGRQLMAAAHREEPADGTSSPATGEAHGSAAAEPDATPPETASGGGGGRDGSDRPPTPPTGESGESAAGAPDPDRRTRVASMVANLRAAAGIPPAAGEQPSGEAESKEPAAEPPQAHEPGPAGTAGDEVPAGEAEQVSAKDEVLHELPSHEAAETALRKHGPHLLYPAGAFDASGGLREPAEVETVGQANAALNDPDADHPSTQPPAEVTSTKHRQGLEATADPELETTGDTGEKLTEAISLAHSGHGTVEGTLEDGYAALEYLEGVEAGDEVELLKDFAVTAVGRGATHLGTVAIDPHMLRVMADAFGPEELRFATPALGIELDIPFEEAERRLTEMAAASEATRFDITPARGDLERTEELRTGMHIGVDLMSEGVLNRLEE